MSPTDQIQELFDRARTSVPAGVAPSPLALHQRLRRRRLRARLATMCSATVAIAVGAVALFAGVASNPAYAVTLYPGTYGSVGAVQLSADQRVMTARLRSVGFPDATVKVVHGTLVVTNGPRDLTRPASFLTASPEILVRAVTCDARSQSGPVSTKPLPTKCSGSQYAVSPVTPNGSSSTGFTQRNVSPDPALSAYATTTPAQDAASPNTFALLPTLRKGSNAPQRFLVGPTLLTISSKVASATVVHARFAGGWIVQVRLNPKESRLWDRVAAANFHRQLAIDLNGVVVEAPLIQPDNASFHSFDGQMQLLAVTKSGAYDLAAALTSGPLVVPLIPKAHHSAFGNLDIASVPAGVRPTVTRRMAIASARSVASISGPGSVIRTSLGLVTNARIRTGDGGSIIGPRVNGPTLVWVIAASHVAIVSYGPASDRNQYGTWIVVVNATSRAVVANFNYGEGPS
jgi:hypothetical protein